MPDSFYLIPEVPPPDDLSDTASYVPSLFIANVPDYPPFDDGMSTVLLNASSGSDSNSPADDNHCNIPSAFTAQLYYSSDDSVHGDTSCNRQTRSPPPLRGRKKATKVTKRKNHGWSMSIQSLEEEYHSSSISGVNQYCLKVKKAVSNLEIRRSVKQCHGDDTMTTERAAHSKGSAVSYSRKVKVQSFGTWRMTVESDLLYTSSDSEGSRKRRSEKPIKEAMDFPTKKMKSAIGSKETGKGLRIPKMATPFENNLMCFAAVVLERLPSLL
ncbi:OLC1v1017215C1 [Oldenlandia corymbosa var. corymbosa]|uniref:OLC1v1017215C1 n=1 Tax=Oldenlandia corymbosa var. corymbosa TaxID=529605 RepID=A0AAV1E8X4_OLDCO|nr:OLC1v1017215C1 [Oldenlandia corymbosa var. corymbosa]